MGHLLEKHSHRAFAHAGNAFCQQFLHQGLQPRLIETLAQRLVEFHTKALVNRVELGLRKSEHFAPEPQVLGIPVLELHQFLPGLRQHRAVQLCGGIDPFVEPLHLGDRILL